MDIIKGRLFVNEEIKCLLYLVLRYSSWVMNYYYIKIYLISFAKECHQLHTWIA